MTKKQIMKKFKVNSKVFEFYLTIPEAGGVKGEKLENLQLIMASIYKCELKYNTIPSLSFDIKSRFNIIIELLKLYRCDEKVIEYGINALCMVSLHHSKKKALLDKFIFGKWNPINYGLDYSSTLNSYVSKTSGIDIIELNNVLPKENIIQPKSFWK